MASTNKTPHFDLPQFIGTDKPSWLGDFNSAMLLIDTALYDVKTDSQDAATSAISASAAAQSAASSAEQAATGVATVTDEVAKLKTDLSATQTQLTTTSNGLTIAQSSIATLETDVETLKTDVSQAQTTASAASTAASSAQSIATINSQNIAKIKKWANDFESFLSYYDNLGYVKIESGNGAVASVDGWGIHILQFSTAIPGNYATTFYRVTQDMLNTWGNLTATAKVVIFAQSSNVLLNLTNVKFSTPTVGDFKTCTISWDRPSVSGITAVASLLCIDITVPTSWQQTAPSLSL